MDQQNFEMNENEKEITTPSKNKKGGMLKGIAIGVIATIIIGWTGINIACIATNSQILITGKESSSSNGNSILNSKVVSKINELAAYMNLYYYDEMDDTALQDGLYEGLLEGLGDKYSV